jgi:hypothetical protein
MGTRSVEAHQEITPTIAHPPTGIVHRLHPSNTGFEKVPSIAMLSGRIILVEQTFGRHEEK